MNSARPVVVLFLIGVACFGIALFVASQPTVDAAPLAQYVDREDIVVRVAGATPVASQNSAREMRGAIKALYVDYGPAISDTTDLTVKTEHAPQQTLLTLTNTLTDGQYYPSAELTGYAGAGVGTFVPFPIADWLNIGVADSWTGTITVTVIWGD